MEDLEKVEAISAQIAEFKGALKVCEVLSVESGVPELDTIIQLLKSHTEKVSKILADHEERIFWTNGQ